MHVSMTYLRIFSAVALAVGTATTVTAAPAVSKVEAVPALFPTGTCAASCGTSSDKASDVSVSVSPCTYDPNNPTPGKFLLCFVGFFISLPFSNCFTILHVTLTCVRFCEHFLTQ